MLGLLRAPTFYEDSSRPTPHDLESTGVGKMPESRVALFLSVDICMTMLTLGLVALRIIYRWTNRRLVISDYLICAAMVNSSRIRCNQLH